MAASMYAPLTIQMIRPVIVALIWRRDAAIGLVTHQE